MFTTTFYHRIISKNEMMSSTQKENIKQSHSRIFLSGIFHARRYQIGKTLLNKQPTASVKENKFKDILFYKKGRLVRPFNYFRLDFLTIRTVFLGCLITFFGLAVF